MQQPKMLEQPQQHQAVLESAFAQRLMGWGVQFAHQTPSNCEQFETNCPDLDQRVRESGEW